MQFFTAATLARMDEITGGDFARQAFEVFTGCNQGSKAPAQLSDKHLAGQFVHKRLHSMGGVDRVRILVEMFKTASPNELFKEVGVYAKVGKNSKGFYKQIKHINGTQVGTPLLMMIMMMMMLMMMLMMMIITDESKIH